MCVIAIVQKEERRLSKEQVDLMWKANDFGVGVAWREFADDQTPRVIWKKGLTLEETHAIVPTLPIPYVVHFRNPSQGTSMEKEGCHPFHVDGDAVDDLEGETTDAILFHNGFWGGWKDKIVDFALKSGTQIPTGEWSDSRALAWSAWLLGEGWLELVEQKTCIFAPERLETFGDGWIRMGDGLIVSNLTWQAEPTKRGRHQQSGQQQQQTQIPMGHVLGPVARAGMTLPPAPDPALPAHYCAVTPPPLPGGVAEPGRFRTDRRHAWPGGTASDARREDDQQESLQEADEEVASGGDGGGSTFESRGRVTALRSYLKGVVGNKCDLCKKSGSDVHTRDGYLCFPCYHAEKRRSEPPKGGECEHCHQRHTTWITMADALWICEPCWRSQGTNGTLPEITREEDLTGIQRDRILSRRELGQETGGTTA